MTKQKKRVVKKCNAVKKITTKFKYGAIKSVKIWKTG